MPKKVWVKGILPGDRGAYVLEGSIWTRSAFEQWNGWTAGKSRRSRPGLKDQWRKLVDDLYWMAPYIQQIIEAGLTHTWQFDGSVEKVIAEWDEETFYSDLEEMRDALNEWLTESAKRRPLQRRIELAQAMIDHPRTEPELKAAAQNRLDAMKRHLEEGERER